MYVLSLVGIFFCVMPNEGVAQSLQFSPGDSEYYPDCEVTATCIQNTLGHTVWQFSGDACAIVLNQFKDFCSGVTGTCGPFIGTNEETSESCETSYLTFKTSGSVNNTRIQCSTSSSSSGANPMDTVEAVLVLKAPPSAPTLNPPLCSAINETSALVTVSWVDDGYNYTLDGAPNESNTKFQENPTDLTLELSTNYTLTLMAVENIPADRCGGDLISEGSVLEMNFEVLPLEKPTLELTLMRPEICNQDSSFILLGLNASFSPLPPVLNLTDSGFDDIPCLTQYDLMIDGANISSVDSECCEGDSCTCQMTVTTNLNIASDEFTVSLVSNAHSETETEDCPPIRISDIRRICDIEFSFTFNEDTGTMATALCTGCNLTVYNATGPMIITGSFPIKLMVNYSYEATCQLTTSDDNCLQSVKYIGSLRADCGLMDWCSDCITDCSDCSITNCLSTQDGCTANFTEGFTDGANANVSGDGCGTTESLLCNNGTFKQKTIVSEDEEGFSDGEVAAISVGSVIAFSIVFEVTVIIAGSVVLHLEIKQIRKGGGAKHYISCTKKALFYMSPVGFCYCYYMSDKKIDSQAIALGPTGKSGTAGGAGDKASDADVEHSETPWWKCCM